MLGARMAYEVARAAAAARCEGFYYCSGFDEAQEAAIAAAVAVGLLRDEGDGEYRVTAAGEAAAAAYDARAAAVVAAAQACAGGGA